MTSRRDELVLSREGEAAAAWLRDTIWAPSAQVRAGHVSSRGALLREHSRRMAVWARELGCEADWPFFDVAEVAGVDDGPIEVDVGAPATLHPTMGFVLHAMVRFAAVGEMANEVLPDPYLPLHYFLERGGPFRVHKGAIDMGMGSLPMPAIESYTSDEPIIVLTGSVAARGSAEDRKRLDDLDGIFRAAGPAQPSHPMLSREIRFMRSPDEKMPYAANVDGVWWVVLVNEPGGRAVYTLRSSDGTEVPFDEWPSAWHRPASE